MTENTAQGPLAGVRVVEFAGLGPVPFCGMLLSDLGAHVVRIDRKGAGAPLFDPATDITSRGRHAIALDLKRPAGVATALRLIAGAEILLEGFRPGVMERLGLGPDPCLAACPRLVYGRMTGWGQSGPLAPRAGHDINYLSLSGALHAIGRREGGPVPPLNLVADYGGGAMFLAFGVLAALTHARASGQGQVVDAAMVDGVASLMAAIYALKASGDWKPQRQSNMLDGGAPFYDTYECADGGWIAIGPIEPQFYAQFLAICEIDDPEFASQWDQGHWGALKAKLRWVIRQRTRADWCARFAGSDACVSPVLDMDEAPAHPHNAARGIFVAPDGLTQPAPAPRFSRTPGAIQGPPTPPGADSAAVLRAAGFSADEIADLAASGVI